MAAVRIRNVTEWNYQHMYHSISQFLLEKKIQIFPFSRVIGEWMIWFEEIRKRIRIKYGTVSRIWVTNTNPSEKNGFLSTLIQIMFNPIPNYSLTRKYTRTSISNESQTIFVFCNFVRYLITSMSGMSNQHWATNTKITVSGRAKRIPGRLQTFQKNFHLTEKLSKIQILG